MREILVEALQSPSNMKFICNIEQISIATKQPNKELDDPTTDVYIQIKANCFEYQPGDLKPRIKTHTFVMDYDKKIFWWSKLADRYNASNHDEMYAIAVVEVEKAVKRKLA